MKKTPEELRAKAKELLREARAAEAAERRATRRQKDRVKYIIGGFFIKHQARQVIAIIELLEARDRELVRAVMPELSAPPQPPTTSGTVVIHPGA